MGRELPAQHNEANVLDLIDTDGSVSVAADRPHRPRRFELGMA